MKQPGGGNRRSMADLVGKSLGKYHIVALLGQGGMAQVYKAAQIDLARYVAVKVMHQRERSDDETLAAAEQFEREAIAVAGLSHPHIVPLFDFGRAADLPDTPYYMVMALLEGPTLKTELAQRQAEKRPFLLTEILPLFNALAGAIDYAHRQNIIHRDLKPANIMFTGEGRVMLTDFGLVRLLTRPDDPDEQVIGTPAYMAPEQVSGAESGPASDIYALGVILYELVTGQTPFSMNHPLDILQHLTDPVPPPRTLNPRLPAAVEQVILTALNKSPADRYASAAALVQALAEASGVYTLPLIYDRRQDWGDAPTVPSFYGRHQDLFTLAQWLVEERCRLVAVLGLAGLGKTTLAVKLVEQVKDKFELVIWRSLRNAPPLAELLADLLKVLAGPAAADLPVEPKISDLMLQLHQRRCLLILDNLETILASPDRADARLYAELLQQAGESRHQSCLLLTSREKPPFFELLERPDGPVRTLSLAGLDVTAGQALLGTWELSGPPEDWRKFVERYSGNPLALKLMAETVQQVFDGQLEAFLGEGSAFFGSLRQILARQAAQLTPLEQSLLLWLALEREGVSRPSLLQNLVPAPTGPDFVEALQGLRRRSLVEKNGQGFTLQNVVLEYATERLIERVCAEISQANLDEVRPTLVTLDSYALLKAQAKDYVRDSQARLILSPILERLQGSLGRAGLEARLVDILTALRRAQPPFSGYAAANVLHLLLQLGSPPAHFDFSNLTLRQAHLVGTTLADANFAGAALLDTVCHDTFGGILALAYRPAGDLLAAGTTKGEVRVWQAATGQPLFNLTGHTNWVQAVAFSPDGRCLASAGTDGAIRWWDTTSGACLRILSGSAERLLSLAFSPEGQWLASAGSDGAIRIWAVESGDCISSLTGHSSWVLSVSFSPDSRHLASSGQDGTVRLWDVVGGRPVYTFTGHTAPIWSLAFSPDGRLLASASDDGTVRVWDVAARQKRHVLAEHSGPVKCVTFSPDGHLLASGGHDRTVRLWLANSGEALKTLPGHTSWVWAVAFHPDGQTLVSGTYRQAIRQWEVSSGRCIQNWHGYAGWVSALAFHPQADTLATGEEDGLVRLWSPASGQIWLTCRGHTDWLSALAYSPDGRRLASASADRTIRLWDSETGQALHCLAGHRGWIWAVAFSPTGELLASSSEDSTIRLWASADGRCMRTMAGHAGWVRSVAFHPGGEVLASGSDDHTLRLWAAASGQLLQVISGHSDWVMSVSFSPDGRLIASGSADRTIRLWDSATGQAVARLEGHTGRVRSLAFDPGGRYLVSGGDDRTVRLWEVAGGRLCQTWAEHTDLVKAVAFGPDGRRVASCSDDGTTRLWELESGRCQRILRSDRPYERMNISRTTGLTGAQKTALKLLGAIEEEPSRAIAHPR